MYNRTFKQSLIEAFKGLKFVIATERNMHIHLILATVAILLSFVLHISRLELVVILFSVALVLVAETVNTAFELLLDYVNGDKYHETIKMLKDIAAGGVLIASINALIVGLIIFGSKLLFNKSEGKMSKIINGLRDVKGIRDANGSTSIINKAVSKSQTPAFNNKGSFFNKIILLFVLFSAGMNLWLFLVIKNLSSERENTVFSLNRIEKLISENSHQIDSVGTEVKRINSNLEAINTRIEIETKKIARLQKDSDAQEFAVNNLKKAKDTLFDRINLLELNLENLKSQDSSDFTRKP